MAHQRAGEREHLLLAAGEGARVLVEARGDPGKYSPTRSMSPAIEPRWT